MAAFQTKYGYELAVPTTWDQLYDIAEFFTRPDEPKNGVSYGVGVYTQKDYDGMIMGFENVLFSYGGDWFDPATFEVEGVVNSPEAVAALEFYHSLYQFAPPGTSNAFFAEMNDAFISGQAAMIMNYFAFFPALANSGINPFADVTGFFAGPAGPGGEAYVALGGQGLSVLAYTSPERQAASMEFIKWFSQKSIQEEWARVGGYTCNIEVLASEEFLTNTPYNQAFSDSMQMVKDFWNIPVFGQMLEPVNRLLHSYIIEGLGDPQELLDQLAAEQTRNPGRQRYSPVRLLCLKLVRRNSSSPIFPTVARKEKFVEVKMVKTGQLAKNSKWRMSERALVNFFIWPTLILLIVVNVFPLFYSIFLSFNNYSVIGNKLPVWVGFQNFKDLLVNEQVWTYFAITGRYAIASVVLQTIFGFGLALLIREKFTGSGIITTLILIPMMLSPVVVGLFWKLMFNPGYGIFNYLISWLGVPLTTDWLAKSDLALWAIVLVDVWMWSPFVMLLVLSGLSAIPDYLYEAAAIDRASGWFQFWRITLPQVAPLVLIAVLFRSIEAFKSFDLAMGLTGGGPGAATRLISIDIYTRAFLGQFKTGQASALAVIVLIVIISISNLYITALNKAKEG